MPRSSVTIFSKRLAFGTSEVDAFAELVRSSPAYAGKAVRWESMDDAGLEQLWDELGAIIVDFLGGDEEDPLRPYRIYGAAAEGVVLHLFLRS